MFIITSGNYVSSSLASEYGKIPSAFVPLQNKRLFEHQIELSSNSEKRVMSLPQGYTLNHYDQKLIDYHNIEIVYVPENLTLGQSFIYVLNVMSSYLEPIKLLHGDTLFGSIPNEYDIYLTGETPDFYNWARPKDSITEEIVYAGYFSFSNQGLLIKSLTEANFDFVKGVLSYKQEKGVQDQFSSTWLDFGHLNTFYRSKTYLTTQRYFNNLTIDEFSVKKSSLDQDKIEAEAEWYSSIPIHLKKYTPAIWDKGQEKNNTSYYQIEYLYFSSMAELFVFGENKSYVWKNILQSCDDFLQDCLKIKGTYNQNSIDVINKLYKEKTISRLKLYTSANNIDWSRNFTFNGVEVPSLSEIVNEINQYISPVNKDLITVMHGDFGFSNILYDFRKRSIKVIDPRGIDANGTKTIFGDIRYDIAKLAHSVIGLYDFIIAGNFVCTRNSKYDINFEIKVSDKVLKCQDYFRNRTFANMTLNEASTYPILINLFLSMLPLHKDNLKRQEALFANALRMYLEFKNNIL